MMKINFPIYLTSLLIIILAGCSGQKTEDQREVVSSVNRPMVIGNETSLLLEDLKENGLAALLCHVVMPWMEFRGNAEFQIGEMKFKDYREFEVAWAEKRVNSAQLKDAMARYMNLLLDPVRTHFSSPEMQKLLADAYPPEEKTKGQKSTNK